MVDVLDCAKAGEPRSDARIEKVVAVAAAKASLELLRARTAGRVHPSRDHHLKFMIAPESPERAREL